MKTKITIAITYLWLGLLAGIAFLETPLKFHAEGVTREIGLSIGSLIFTVLNKVEIVAGILILLFLFLSKFQKKSIFVLAVIPFVLVLVEGFYLYPILSDRAVMIGKGIEPEKAPYHIFSMAFILIKFIALNLFGIVQFKKLR